LTINNFTLRWASFCRTLNWADAIFYLYIKNIAMSHSTSVSFWNNVHTQPNYMYLSLAIYYDIFYHKTAHQLTHL